MTRRVACALVRQGGAWLAFRHPLAGAQLVKGGIEAGEAPEAAALCELSEEAGVAGRDARVLGRRDDLVAGEDWTLVAVAAPPLPERWVHRCADDGGHDLAFFWHPDGASTDAFDRRYARVLEETPPWSS